ncbi:MAG: quinone-dependent dihydroorotate dehydrogenase [Verrucomicrobiales bacterium]|nr:quinone-dependent dihydroorotate dehydrogenase [Verrucomicrobiales bacterium]
MSWFYRGLVRPCLFAQESECIHNRTLRALGVASRSAVLRGLTSALYGSPRLPVKAFGLEFPNPVGLAAGMDKFAEAVPIWECLGFGFAELGGVTEHPQPGNDAPRMFRIIPDEALINRMGFNNPGVEAFASALAQWKGSGAWPSHPVGVNLGKSKITPIERAAEDYVVSFRRLADLADFFVVNVSSPNTPNLRKLQDRTALEEILIALNEANVSMAHPPKPLLVKVAPDLTFEALDEIVGLAEQQRLAGIVATNTTVTRPAAPPISTAKTYAETGGLSGRPLTRRSTEVIAHLYGQSRGRIPIIGVGGIFNAQDAWDKVTAGATLLQVYTGMVYEGPGIASAIVRGLANKLSASGLTELAKLVGANVSARNPDPGPQPNPKSS